MCVIQPYWIPTAPQKIKSGCISTQAKDSGREDVLPLRGRGERAPRQRAGRLVRQLPLAAHGPEPARDPAPLRAGAPLPCPSSPCSELYPPSEGICEIQEGRCLQERSIMDPCRHRLFPSTGLNLASCTEPKASSNDFHRTASGRGVMKTNFMWRVRGLAVPYMPVHVQLLRRNILALSEGPGAHLYRISGMHSERGLLRPGFLWRCRGSGGALRARTCATVLAPPARATRRAWSPPSSCTTRLWARASNRCAPPPKTLH